MNDYREILQQHFEQRSTINNSYSMNAFARDLRLKPSHLSEVMRQKKGLSRQSAQAITKRLRMPKEESTNFVHLVELAHSRSKARKIASLKAITIQSYEGKMKELADDMFYIIKDWYHFALMEYLKVSKEEFSITSAARFFKLQPKLVRESLKRLVNVGILREKRGRYETPTGSVHAPIGVPMAAKRMHHIQILKKAQRSYLQQSFEERDYMSSILAIEREKIPEAKAIIRQFHKEMDALLSMDTKNPNDVYCFSTQLFSLKGYSDENF